MTEASSRGAALLALEASGALEDLAAAPAPMGKTYEPDPANRDPLPGSDETAAGPVRYDDGQLKGWLVS